MPHAHKQNERVLYGRFSGQSAMAVSLLQVRVLAVGSCDHAHFRGRTACIGRHQVSRCRVTWPLFSLSPSDGPLSHAGLPLQLRCIALMAMLAAPGALGFTVPVGSLASPVKAIHNRCSFSCTLLRRAQAHFCVPALAKCVRLRAVATRPLSALARACFSSHLCSWLLVNTLLI